ncbi:ATP-binding protein [Nocardioides sp. NPDC051685]|uniref:ATP-binding protein n=1 Tax=Nocardioides sp. NPDC051685 TaxID=3364334 RepID=UPI0037B771B2
MVVGRAETNPLVGRRRELDTIKRLLEGHRLVTLTGVGGAGKTRLARRVTSDLSRVYKEAAWIVELADVTDPDLLGHGVARAIGLQVKSADFDPALITEFLAGRRALLTIDNCEHLTDACAELVEDILDSCPGVRVLTTSQRALGVRAESLFVVPPLTMPSPGVEVPVEGLGQYESISLFVERAAAIEPGFSLTAGNAPAIVELCRALEGIPLALELAAARIRVLSPQAMLERLEDRYQLLNRGFRGKVPDRQRSLEASVNWTHDLCTDDERRLWAELSVFRGGFGFDAAEAVAGGWLGDAFLDVLDSLVERSVVRRDDLGQGARFRMLETLRLYGARELERAGMTAEVRRRHRDHFLGWALHFGETWTGPDQVALLGEMHADHANIRAALRDAIETGDTRDALRLVGSLEQFWITGGFVSEARRWLDQALAGADSIERGPTLSAGLRVGVWFALMQVDFASAEAIMQGLRLLAQEPVAEDDPVTPAEIALAEGVLAGWNGDTERGVDLIEAAVARFADVGDLSTRCFGLVIGGMLAGFIGQAERGRAALLEAVALTEERSELYMRSFGLAILGVLALADGDRDAATSTLREVLAMKRELGDQLGTALTLEFLAWVSVAEGRGERAATLMGSATSIWNTLGIVLNALPHFAERREQCEQATRSALRPEDYDRATAAGAAMDRAVAIAYALEETSVAQKPAVTRPRHAGRASSPLTRREQQVAVLVHEGLSNQQIAERLVLSTRTAEAHVENILRKLGFTSRTAIASWVAEHQDEVSD